MIDLSRVRTRVGSDPHFVNVDVDYTEVGYLELNGSGEVVRAVAHDGGNAEHRELVDLICRLARPIVSAAASAR